MCSATALCLGWWVFACCPSSSLAYNLPFCGPNVMDHFVCDMYPFVKTSLAQTLTSLPSQYWPMMGPSGVVIFMLLLISYGVILHSLKNLSQKGVSKALSTCGSYITVVLLFFVPCISMYVELLPLYLLDKFLTVFYTVVTPMLNPLIYTLEKCRNENAMKSSGPEKEMRHMGNVCHIFNQDFLFPGKMCDYLI